MDRIEALCLLFGTSYATASIETVQVIGNSLTLTDEELKKIPDDVFHNIETFLVDSEQYIDSFEEDAHKEHLRALLKQLTKQKSEPESKPEPLSLSQEMNRMKLLYFMGIFIATRSLKCNEIIHHPRWKLLFPLVLDEIKAVQNKENKNRDLARKKLKARVQQLTLYASGEKTPDDLRKVGQYMRLLLRLTVDEETKENEELCQVIQIHPSSQIFRLLFIDPDTDLKKVFDELS